MNRAEFQQLAEERLRAAQTLLSAGLWSSAYYLAGYAVECGLKSCIFARVEREGVLFEDKRFGERCWTHSPEELISLADLKKILGVDCQANPILAQHWDVVVKWDEASRYRFWSEQEARALISAVADSTNGVLPWIRHRW